MSTSSNSQTEIKLALNTEQQQKLDNWMASNCTEVTQWIEKIHDSFNNFLLTSNVGLNELLVKQDGSGCAFTGALKGLGIRSDFSKVDIDNIETTARFYLKLLGFRQTNLLFVNNLPKAKEVLDPPGTVDLTYRLAVEILDAVSALFKKPSAVRALTSNEYLGLLVISLTIRDGALSSSEVLMALNEMAQRAIIRNDQLCYVYGPISKAGVHLRRLHLSGLSIALSVHVKTIHYSMAMVEKSLTDIGKKLKLSSVTRNGLRFRTLVSAGQHYLRLSNEMPQFVVDYAQQKIVSESLEEKCFARLTGKTPHPKSIRHETMLREKQQRIRESFKDFEISCEVQEVTRACSSDTNRKVAKANAVSIIEMHLASGQLSEVDRLILEWTLWMLTVRDLAASTAKGHLSSIYRPLQASLAQLNLKFQDHNPDVWDRLMEEMTRDRSPRDNLFDAIVELTSYLNFITQGEFKHSGYSEAAIVNSYVMSEDEKNGALALVEIINRKDTFLTQQAVNAIELAFYLGVRRWEFLGLAYRDVNGKIDPILKVRTNTIRWVKTDMSNRVISLKLVSDRPFYEQWRQQAQPTSGNLPGDSILESHGFEPRKHERRMFDAINDALYRQTGSREITFHTLRHTAVCRNLLALYWDELALDELRGYAFFDEIAKAAPNIKSVLLKSHTKHFAEHKTISSMVGHLSFSTTAGHYFHFMDLLRWAHVKKANLLFPQLDEPSTLLNVSHLSIDIEPETTHQESIDIIIKNYPDNFIHQIAVQQVKTNLNGLGLQNHINNAIKTMSLPENERDEYLKAFMPSDEKRQQYLSDLKLRVSFLENLLTGLNQLSRKDSGVLVMPEDRTIQLVILDQMNRISEKYPSTDTIKNFANELLEAIKHLKINRKGVFNFSDPIEAQKVLEPVSQILDEATTKLTYWYYSTVRESSKTLKKVEHKETVNSLTDIKPNPNKRGALLVTFEFGNETSTSPQRTLIWVMSSIYAVFGNPKKINGEST